MQRLILCVFFAVLCAACGNTGMVKRNDLFQMRADAASAYAAGDLNKAERLFKQLTERVPGESEFWFRLANVYARTQQPDDAVRCYREALVRDPQNAKAWHNMGIVYLRQSGNAFTQLTAQLQPEDPMYSYTLRVNEKILELLAGQNAPGEQPAPADKQNDVAP